VTQCIDASIAVKWFHKGELFENEAHTLLQRIIGLEADFVVNEWITLEVVRALVKAGYPKEKVNEAFDVLIELMNIGALRKISVSDVIHLAKFIEIEYNLYAADAVHVATAIQTNASVLWTEDHHMQKKSLRDLYRHHLLEVKSLKDLQE
jgi:predicted nucleic acid-binding protein